MIELVDITKTYGTKKGYKTTALDGISLHIEQGKLTAVIGKSGCGKSTLLNVLGGLVMPDSGEYYFKGQKLAPDPHRMAVFRRDHIGFIVQNFALINNRTAFENIDLACPEEWQKHEAEKNIERIAKKLGIYDKLNSYPAEMSGGECQRTAIARALIKDPDIILADEPTGALDSKNSMTVLQILKKLVANNKTIVIVTHDMSIARQCDNIIEMRDGRISG